MAQDRALADTQPMEEVVCSWCRKPITLTTDENGWPTLPDATVVTLDHAECLRAQLRADA